MTAGTASRLQQYAMRGRRPPATTGARCELCAEPLGEEHQHLLDLHERDVRCACRACALLFDRRAAAVGNLRRIPDRRWALPPAGPDDGAWVALGIPVGVAFVVDHESEVVAYYPSPAGITREEIPRPAWDALQETERSLQRMEPEVEALLVRSRGATADRFVVPIDDCFQLVGTVRTMWEGWSGGDELWSRLDEWFDALATRAKIPSSDGVERRPA